MNSDKKREARLRKRRKGHAAERSEKRETRLARRRVANRSRYTARTANSGEESVALLKALSRGRQD